MRLSPLRVGAPVRAAGVVVRLRDGWALVEPWHVEVGDVRAAGWLGDLGVDDLDLAVPVEVDGGAVLEAGVRVGVRGRWGGRAVAVEEVAPAPLGPDVWQPPPPAGSDPRPTRPPARVLLPPTDLERALLEDGTLTSRLPYGDGTVHVVADDVARVTELLAPLHGDRLRVERAVHGRAEREVARAALGALDERAVATCGVGEEVLDERRPAERVHTLEVRWVTEELAEVLAPVADGLVRVAAHVEVLRAPDGGV